MRHKTKGDVDSIDMFTLSSNVKVFMATYSHHVSGEERMCY